VLLKQIVANLKRKQATNNEKHMNIVYRMVKTVRCGKDLMKYYQVSPSLENGRGVGTERRGEEVRAEKS